MGVGADSGALFSSGVLVERNEEVALSADFESAVEKYRPATADLSREVLSRLVRERVDADAVAEPFVRLGEIDPRAIGELCALHDRLDPSGDGWLSTLPVLRLFRPESVPDRGAPGPFVPVPASLVPHLAGIYDRVLVYVWLDDCPPCDALRTELESVFERPREVMPFAVYGPDDRAFLADEYDVTAGPALLFVRDGRVDARLYGSYEREVIEAELAALRW